MLSIFYVFLFLYKFNWPTDTFKSCCCCYAVFAFHLVACFLCRLEYPVAYCGVSSRTLEYSLEFIFTEYFTVCQWQAAWPSVGLLFINIAFYATRTAGHLFQLKLQCACVCFREFWFSKKPFRLTFTLTVTVAVTVTATVTVTVTVSVSVTLTAL